MRKASEYLFLWALGGSLYYALESLFRGWSHWSMFLLGGICMLFCVKQGLWVHWEDPVPLQMLRCTVFIAAGEFITGIIVNKWLHLDIWDYSALPFNLFGQVCLYYLAIFSLLGLSAIFLGGYAAFCLYGEEKPPFLQNRKVL